MRKSARLASVVVVGSTLMGGGLGASLPAGGSTPGRSSESVSAGARIQIEEGFRHLLSPDKSASSGRGVVQGDNGAMESGLARAADTSVFSVPASHLGATAGQLTETFGQLARVGAAVITVPVTFTMTAETPDWSTSNHFVGTAVRIGGGWKVSWATACTLVETAGIVCPTAPKGIEATVPPPSFDPPQSTAAPLSPGLVDPSGMAIEPDGNLLIADTGRDQVLVRTPSGQLEVFAGTGTAGFSGDGGPATDADLNFDGPAALAVTSDGTVYITDSQNQRVRAVSPSGIITTVAGNGVAGHTGDGGPATDAELGSPTGVAIGPDGSLYIADGMYVRKVAPSRIITTIAGGGPPEGVDVDPNGPPLAFVPESLAFDGAGNLDVFSFSPKMIFQLPAGPTGPSGTDIRVVAPDYANALAPDPDGGVVVALHGTGIQRIIGSQATSVVDFSTTPIAGYGITGLRGAFSPEGVAVAPDGTIYADTFGGTGTHPDRPDRGHDRRPSPRAASGRTGDGHPSNHWCSGLPGGGLPGVRCRQARGRHSVMSLIGGVARL